MRRNLFFYAKNASKSVRHDDFVFGSLAVMTVLCTVVDPWLCVTAFGRFCLYRTNGSITNKHIFRLFILVNQPNNHVMPLGLFLRSHFP